MYVAQKNQNPTIELAETQASIKKEPVKKALNLNGGTDAYRFELLVSSFIKNLRDTDKICSLIELLGRFA